MPNVLFCLVWIRKDERAFAVDPVQSGTVALNPFRKFDLHPCNCDELRMLNTVICLKPLWFDSIPGSYAEVFKLCIADAY